MWRYRLAAMVVLAVTVLLAMAIAAATARGEITARAVGFAEDLPTDKKLAKIASLSNHRRLDVPDGELLAPFLVPRVSGTAANVKVREFIAQHFRKLQWDVQIDNFTDTTPPPPHGPIEFANVIATKSPGARRRLILAAHFDSKFWPPPGKQPGEFIGASDSAVPCAILLDLAQTLNDYLDANAKDHTLQMIFFDGEEAFVEWTKADSLYGSRHLAEKWATMFLPLEQSSHAMPQSMLDTIDLFVLLDLMGTTDSTFPNLQGPTGHYYQALQDIEKQLIAADLLMSPSDAKSGEIGPAAVADDEEEVKPYIVDGPMAHMEDDHVPFLERGVPVVHMISYPFPEVWHSLDDNASAIDPMVVYNFNTIFRIFLSQYFGLSSHI